MKLGTWNAGVMPPVLRNARARQAVIKFKDLPFTEIGSYLVPPTISTNDRLHVTIGMVSHSYFYFRMTPDQIRLMEERWQILIRVCSDQNSSISHLHDTPPYGFSLFVNGRVVFQPSQGQQSDKVSSKPLDITEFVTIGSLFQNSLIVCWHPYAYQRNLAVTVVIVKRDTPESLLANLQLRRSLSIIDTMNRVRTVCSADDSGISAPKCIRISLTCPLGSVRMKTPCRSIKCKHIQCFDATAFIQMAVGSYTLKCPACKEELRVEDLHMDEFLMQVLQILEKFDGNYVDVYYDDECMPTIIKKGDALPISAITGSAESVIVLSPGFENIRIEPEVIDISSSDDEDNSIIRLC